MTKDEALRLALDTLKEVREETFRLMRNGERLYAEDKVWSTIITIQESLETKDEPVAWEQFHEHMAGPNYVAPQRTWVGLTDEDMNNALDYWSDKSRSAYGGAHAANGEYVDMIETWRYIETKLKERNA